MPYTLFDAFKKDCRENPDDVTVTPKAAKDARDIFKLHTVEDLLDFIGNDGLDNVTHFNTTVWRKNPDPDKVNNPQYVHDYTCRTNGKPYYIAIIYLHIFFGNTADNWKIKSFHLDENAFLPMQGQLAKLLNLPSGK